MRSLPLKVTASSNASGSVRAIVRPAASARPASTREAAPVAPFLLRQAVTPVLSLGPRKPPVSRRVRDVAPGEVVPSESRIVFRAGAVSFR